MLIISIYYDKLVSLLLRPYSMASYWNASLLIYYSCLVCGDTHVGLLDDLIMILCSSKIEPLGCYHSWFESR
jgi:hypothetical protein